MASDTAQQLRVLAAERRLVAECHSVTIHRDRSLQQAAVCERAVEAVEIVERLAVQPMTHITADAVELQALMTLARTWVRDERLAEGRDDMA